MTEAPTVQATVFVIYQEGNPSLETRVELEEGVTLEQAQAEARFVRDRLKGQNVRLARETVTRRVRVLMTAQELEEAEAYERESRVECDLPN